MQKKRNNKQIPAKLKDEILVELSKPGCVVSNLAKTYDLSSKTLYSWRKTMGLSQETVKSCNKAGGNFIELTLEEAKAENTRYLHKAELSFNDFSILIDGKFSSNKLFEIVKILEAVC